MYPQAGPLHPGVVYVGHIPHGFYEEQMRKYFSQFGTVTRLKLARSRKVGCIMVVFVVFLSQLTLWPV